MDRLGRLPIRVRVTLAFAGVMALVLAATGAFLLLRLGAELDATIEQGLRSRAQDIAALVRETDSGLDDPGDALTEDGESAAQIYDPSGAVLDATPAFAFRPLLSRDALARALDTTLVLDKPVPDE